MRRLIGLPFRFAIWAFIVPYVVLIIGAEYAFVFLFVPGSDFKDITHSWKDFFSEIWEWMRG